MSRNSTSASALAATTLDTSRSFVERISPYPKNIEAVSTMTFTRTQPMPGATSALIPTVIGGGQMRPGSATVVVHHSMVELPKKPMTPRVFDARVGYFSTMMYDYSKEEHRAPRVRYITRWRLERKDPSAAVSEPVTPIVYYIDSATPTKWRPSRDQTGPRIDAFANLSSAGLSGVTTSQNLGSFAQLFPGIGAVPAVFPGGYGQSLSNLVNGNFPTAQVGVSVSLPLRNRAAEAQLAVTSAETRRLRTQETQITIAIETDVRNALQFVQSARARWEAAGLARRSAEEQYASEQRQFQAGTSSVFLVLQRQTDMINARNRETRAHADFAESLANLDRATARTIESRGITIE